MAREIIAETPIPTPSAMLFTTSTTGKVKLRAASCVAPNFPTKKVSTRLKATMPSMPTIIGAVSLISSLPIGPSISFALVFFIYSNFPWEMEK